MGIAVFIRIPEVMPRLEAVPQLASVLFFIRFCLYLMGVVLVGGGARKIAEQYRLHTGQGARADSDGGEGAEDPPRQHNVSS